MLGISPTGATYGIVPGWLIYYAAVLIALILFGRRAFYLYRLLTVGKPAVRWDSAPQRLRSVLVFVLGQLRLLRGDFWPGLMHATIFWGFIVLTLGTIEFFGKGVTRSFFLPLAGDSPAYVLLQDFFALAVIAAVAYAAFRRLATRPKRLTLSAEGLVILMLIAALMMTDLAADAARMALAPEPGDRWAFAATALSALLSGAPRETTLALYHLFWWSHAFILLGFLVWLPYSKHLHIMAATFNVFFRPLTPKGEFPGMNLEAAESFGVGKITEFTWKDLFDLYNCTECGRCTDGCPAKASGKQLDPKMVILDLQEHLFVTGPTLLTGRGDGSAEGAAEMVGQVIADNVLWACTTCRHCVDACPVFIEHVPKIVDMRRHLVLNESRFPEELKPAFRNLENNGNPWQFSWQARADWARDLGVRVMADAREAEYLYWVGCYGSFDERNRNVARSVIRVLQAAGVDFAILGNEEKCTGEPARRLGNEYLYQTLAQENVKTLKRYAIQKIVTACPHCFNTIRNEYPKFDGHFKVVHHAQLIEELIRSGRLRVRAAVEGRCAYHDSCYLGRYNDIYDEPRAVLGAVSKGEVVEMRLRGERSFCCGGGGGRVWLEEKEGRRVNQIRVEQAMEVEPDLLVSACPFCLTMFEDGVKAKGMREKIKTHDIAELVADSLTQ